LVVWAIADKPACSPASSEVLQKEGHTLTANDFVIQSTTPRVELSVVILYRKKRLKAIPLFSGTNMKLLGLHEENWCYKSCKISSKMPNITNKT